MKKYCKGIPEYVYLVEEGAWTAGPFVKPQPDRTNRKFKLVEVPMDEPKKKKSKEDSYKVPPPPKAEGCDPDAYQRERNGEMGFGRNRDTSWEDATPNDMKY